MDEYRDLIVTQSPLINEPVNRFTLPPGSIEDLVARVKINRTLGNWVGTCHQRCTGLDCLSALSIVTYDIDQKHQTNYFERFKEFLKHIQKNDLTCNAGVTDVKGDRSLGPQDQADTISDIHGGGSPEAHRVTTLRETDLERKKKAAKLVAGIEED